MKINFKKCLLIIVSSSLLGITYNYFSPSGIPLIPQERKLQWAADSLFTNDDSDKKNISDSKTNNANEFSIKEKKETNLTRNNLREEKPKSEIIKEKDFSEPAAIHLNQAYKLYQQNILFIDAREPEDFKAAHIKNAINLPMDHFDDYKYMLGKIDKNQKIVTYCAGSDCDLSIVLGNVLFDLGYKKLYVFFGGWNEWIKAKYPVTKEEETN